MRRLNASEKNGSKRFMMCNTVHVDFTNKKNLVYLYEYLFLRQRRLRPIYFCNCWNVIISMLIFMYLKQIKELFLIPKFWRIFLIGLQTLSILKHLHLQTPRVKLERKHFSLSACPTHQFNVFYTLRLRYFLS